jgi:hypothetical protein
LIATYANTLSNPIEHIVGTFGATKHAEIDSNDEASSFITALASNRS